jgi:hypothetical protein
MTEPDDDFRAVQGGKPAAAQAMVGRLDRERSLIRRESISDTTDATDELRCGNRGLMPASTSALIGFIARAQSHVTNDPITAATLDIMLIIVTVLAAIGLWFV